MTNTETIYQFFCYAKGHHTEAGVCATPVKCDPEGFPIDGNLILAARGTIDQIAERCGAMIRLDLSVWLVRSARNILAILDYITDSPNDELPKVCGWIATADERR